MLEINSKAIPEGYMQNSLGHLVPVETISDIDKARNELVMDLVARAKIVQSVMTEFKGSAMGDIQAFVELSAEKYGANLGGKKGNVLLTSFDGRYRVQRSMSEYIIFDERLQVAKSLIDECIHEWTDGARVEIKALVEHAFKTDAEGRVSTGRILGLKSISIDHPKWRQAMLAITDSMQIAGTKAYVRLYERVGDDDRWEPISLDMAGL
ncbi:DUF3164 family protein [Desulforegula conservatrix]|uniref:DUF3164 family protein n=1 Tax=Desulforegula conservatrix TaxID=153026 RepID=UPI00041536A6|nr:DUF3164 family protein [Desulforegula conservatrix]